MFKLMDKKIIAILRWKFLPNWPYDVVYVIISWPEQNDIQFSPFKTLCLGSISGIILALTLTESREISHSAKFSGRISAKSFIFEIFSHLLYFDEFFGRKMSKNSPQNSLCIGIGIDYVLGELPILHLGICILLYVPSQQLWSWRDGQFP